jgi:hypothetical protein
MAPVSTVGDLRREAVRRAVELGLRCSLDRTAICDVGGAEALYSDKEELSVVRSSLHLRYKCQLKEISL